jgi:pyruvate/2-oxoglutarate dehydrogenase complex dihydrolipoamide acyltransferase (E2) component
MGMSTISVDVVAIRVTVGQEVGPDDPLVEIEGEKASFEVTAGHAGVVREILVQEGDTCDVGHVLMRVEPRP